MQFFPRDKGRMAFFEGFSLKMAFSLYRVGKSHIARGRSWGSLIGVPQALGGSALESFASTARTFTNLEASFRHLGFGVKPTKTKAW